MKVGYIAKVGYPFYLKKKKKKKKKKKMTHPSL
jgi:hypothetical protein